MKTFTKILLILCLTFLLAGCGDNSKKHIVFDYGSRSVPPETTPRLKIGLKGFTDARQMDNVVCKVFSNLPIRIRSGWSTPRSRNT